MARSQELAHLFQQPASPAHRHYEICRAYFYESAPADEIARRFHLHSDSVRAIVRDFARAPDVNSLFAAAKRGPKAAPKHDAIRERACALRRQGATLADIRAALERDGLDVRLDPVGRVFAMARLEDRWERRSLLIGKPFLATTRADADETRLVEQLISPYFKIILSILN